MITHPNVKINLGLDVLRKRQDGFHDIETLFLPYFDICDTLEIRKREDIAFSDKKLSISINKKGGVDWEPESDLTARAYRILDADFDLPPVEIILTKHSPVGAGLGGGSSDAAFALKMLNEMFSLSLSEQKLADYASRLGSDCAFFIYNKPMFASGRGEILSPATWFEEKDFFGANAKYELKVVVPEGVSVSTAEAYSKIKPAIPEKKISEIVSMPVEDWKGFLKNDFETSVFDIHPELSLIKKSLYDLGAIYASMSGSGSALYGVFPIY